MTEHQKFVFDLKGWILLPELLSEQKCADCRDHILGFTRNPESIPEWRRNSYSGPCADLLDHPVIVDILRTIISPDMTAEWVEPGERAQPKESTVYGFRCDNSFYMIRSAGNEVPRNPHNGGPAMGPSHNYDIVNGSIFSPAVRVAWELTAVEHAAGGTVFLSGSHKSFMPVPQEYTHGDEYWETYSCPAGSAVLFTENVCHGSAPWTNPDHERVAVFNHYMHYCMRFHRTVPNERALDEMSALRRSLFRDVWMLDVEGGKLTPNVEDTRENRAQGKPM